MALLRKKASEEDVQAVLNLIQEKAVGMGVTDPLIPSTDAYVTSICAIGSKSLSHVLSCIERCKERLLAIGPQSEIARRQIITSVMDYWKDQPGIGVNIIDKLLNYTILTPMSVIEWALIYHNDQGRNLAQSHIYEMVFTTVFKVTNRVRQIVAARDQEGLPEDQVNMLNETLVRERGEQKVMFRVIEDSLISPVNGFSDEKMGNGNGENVEEKLLRKWPARWLKVFQRKLAVEEAVVGDAVKSHVNMEV
jgi:nuclear cap-binding protein subunit 1